MTTIYIILGLILLVFGRRLYWLFVAIAGFYVGMTLATQYVIGQPEWVILVIALVVGAVGAVLAVVLQRLAAGIVGFLVGYNLTLTVLNLADVQLTGPALWIPTVLVGLLFAVLAFALLDWGLIILSSLFGAELIIGQLQLDAVIAALLFVALVLVGIIIQAGIFYRDNRRPVARRT